ncbi:MAG: alpha/beta hydrolase [Candidatus Omnitrophota bacterium]
MLKNIVFLVIFTIFGFIWFRNFEWRSIFFPIKDFAMLPDSLGIEYEDIFTKTDDGLTLNAWFIPAKDNTNLTIFFSHGNGGNISHRFDKITILRNLGLNVFIYDYRGYGKSQGRPSEEGIYLDAQAAYKYLTKEKGLNPDDIIAYGESLGATVTVDLASKVKLKALILEGAFTNAKEMSKEIYPFLPTFILKSKLDSISKIKNIHIPKLFIHSINDEIVPIHLNKKLFNAALGEKTFVTIAGGHNTSHIDSQKEYTQGIATFIAKITDLQYNK